MDMIQVYKILMTSLVKDLFEFSDQKLWGLSKKLSDAKHCNILQTAVEYKET